LGARVERVEIGGQIGWLKRVEKMGVRHRIVKGDPRQLFEAERAAYRSLQQKALPFPKFIAEDADHFVMEDAGPTLFHILRSEGADSPRFRKAVLGAAEELAGIHLAGVSHGRPALRDICWKDGRITFIDLERYAPRRNSRDGHAWDVLIFLYSLAVDLKGDLEIAEAARDAYRAADRKDIWGQAEQKMALVKRFDFALRPLGRLLSHKRDFRPLGPFLDVF